MEKRFIIKIIISSVRDLGFAGAFERVFLRKMVQNTQKYKNKW